MKIHPKRMLKFKLNYDSDPRLQPQRFGQAFCNEFDISDPALFYEDNRKEAEEYIWRFYVA